MKIKHRHALIEDLARDEREDIWNAYWGKYPNYKWTLSFFALWAVWASVWVLISFWLNSNYLQGAWTFVSYFTCLFLIGMVGGVMIIGRVMLPVRVREFHEYLDSKSLEDLKTDLGIVQHGGNSPKGQDA